MMQETRPSVQIVTTAMDALYAVRELKRRGIGREHIYVMAHDNDETRALADTTAANQIGLAEEGVFESMANLFRSRGDVIRSKLAAMGIPDSEAERYEEELDSGRLLVITDPQ